MEFSSSQVYDHDQEHLYMPFNLLLGTSLVVQWLRVCISHAGITGSIPGWGIKIPMPMVW